MNFCVVYDEMWYIGMIKEVDTSNSDILVDFMHPGGPSPSLHWPEKRDVCWIPFQHVLWKIDVPSLVTARGQYYLSDASKNKIVAIWEKYKA